jgi:hypothetical protein
MKTNLAEKNQLLEKLDHSNFDTYQHDAIIMLDLLNPIDDLNAVNDTFFEVVSSAFRSHLTVCPDKAAETFDAFNKLQDLFRKAARHSDFISEKITEKTDKLCDELFGNQKQTA